MEYAWCDCFCEELELEEEEDVCCGGTIRPICWGDSAGRLEKS